MFDLPSQETLRTIALITAAIGQTLFVLLYATFPWWDNFVGRALFLKAISLAALLDVLMLGRKFDWPYEDVTFVVLYLFMTAGIWWQFVAFLRVRLGSAEKQQTGVGR